MADTDMVQMVLSFDGKNDHLNLGKKPEFKPEDALTLEAWIFPVEEKQWAGIAGNLFDTGEKESGYGLLLAGSGGVCLGVESVEKGKMPYVSSGPNVLKLEAWNHVAATVEGQCVRIYVNGELKNEQTLNLDNLCYEYENDFLIGAYKDDNEMRPFQGKISDVRLWRTARTADEIKGAMGARLKGDESGLAAYWPLDEGWGNKVIDRRVDTDEGENAEEAGNHGVRFGAVWTLTPAFIEPAASSVVIVDVFHRGRIKRTQADEFVEIGNKGMVEAQLTGWRVNAGDSGQDFVFPEGIVLRPGQCLRVYTHEVHKVSGGFNFGSSVAIWNDKGDVGALYDAAGALVNRFAYGDKVEGSK